MEQSDANTAACRDFVVGLAEGGLDTVFISPGSRNTPLAIAFSLEGSITDLSIRDERSAGFAAVGHAKRTGMPAAVLCTSGSAGTHYYPAVVEADQSSTPMIVVTSDRPRRLRGTFAPQTMDQTDLFGSHAKASLDIDLSQATVRESAREAVATSHNGVPGAVHLNVPLDEPLTPELLPPPTNTPRAKSAVHTKQAGIPELAGKRVLVVAGGYHGPAFATSLTQWAEAIRAPLIADPQARTTSDNLINGDLVAGAGWLAAHPPEVVVRFGSLPPSKPLSQWLSTGTTDQIHIHRSRLRDHLGTASQTIGIRPIEAVGETPRWTADADYLDEASDASKRAEQAAATTIEGTFPSEPLVAHHLTSHLPNGSALVVASSMPIRDVETFGVGRTGVLVIGNRGVNGIDGILSTALGVAANGTPTTVLAGDVSALHDVSALGEIARLRAPVRVVVVNNDGGGIFSFLPQHRTGVIPTDLYEKHWGTAHGLRLAAIANSFGMSTRSGADEQEFIDRIASPVVPELIEIATDRRRNVALHDSVRSAVRTALR